MTLDVKNLVYSLPDLPSSETAYTRIYHLLTRNGEIPLDIAQYSLTPLERFTLEILKSGHYKTQEFSDTEQYAVEQFLVVYRKNYRIGIKRWDGSNQAEDAYQFLIELTTEDLERLSTAQQYFSSLLQLKLREVHDFIAQTVREDAISSLLSLIDKAVRHFSPLVAFLGENIYTSEGYWGNNLANDNKGKKSFLTQLREASPHEWSEEQRQFVFALHILFLSGGQFRLEGMNWMQLDPITLEEFLNSRARIYSAAITEPLSDGFSLLSIQEKARWVKEREGQLKTNYQFYRRINGSTLNKEVKFFPHSKLQYDTLPEALNEDLQRDFPECVSSSQNTASLLQSLALNALEKNKIKELLVLFTRSGLRETNSDFFMTRFPCSLSIPPNYTSLQKSDFFCVVLTREGFDPAEYGVSKYTLNGVRWNYASRMQFNGWKIWYGNLTAEERSPKQYWVIPPELPDISVYEHMLHAGHHENGVVQSIRSPGPMSLTDFATGKKRVFIGTCDIRSGRSSLEPLYGGKELFIVIQHRVWLQTIVQHLADYGVSRGTPVRIDCFGRDFYTDEGQ